MARSKLTPADIETIRYLASLGVSRRKIATLHFRGRISRTTVGYVLDFGKVPTKSDLMMLRAQTSLATADPPRDIHNEIQSYSPCLASSFNRGLGTGTPRSMINKTVTENSEGNCIRFARDRFALLTLLNEKALDPLANRFREALKKRVTSLGFDGTSDNDLQFGELNDMAACGLAVLRALGDQAKKLKMSSLVDACIVYRRPSWRSRLEGSDRQLRCPRCRRLRSFVRSRDGGSVTCISCGLDVPLNKARFRIAVRKVDPEYVDLVHVAVTSKSFGLGVEPGPLTSPVKARIHFGESENESDDQSSEQ